MKKAVSFKTRRLFYWRDPDWTRTSDLLLRRQLLYPAELRDHFNFIFSFAVPVFKYFSR